MNYTTFRFGVVAVFQVAIGSIVMALLLASCGGGHNAGDTNPTSQPATGGPISGPDSFLIFPNPQSNPAINSRTYTEAYYNTIDPNNNKDTLDKWKAANHFGDLALGSEVQAVFGDVRDLGYGRYMHGRKNADGTFAFMVENYLVWPTADYTYSSLNLDAAIAQDQRWHVSTNAIEFSPGPGCTAAVPNSKCQSFAKYFTFNPVTGARLLVADLDGRGDKSMPGICISCHGGRGDALLPAATNATTGLLFPIMGNPASGVRGDVTGKLHFFEPDSFDFSTLPGYTRADQEAAIKELNKYVLCTFPLPNGVTAVAAEDICRSPGTRNDQWQGVAAASIVKEAYGGNGLPNATYVDTYVPTDWVAQGHTDLYLNVVKPACRVCHLLRGTGTQSDIDFSTFSGFQSFTDRIKEHVIDKGNMPLDRILNIRFWAIPSMHNSLVQYLQAPNPLMPSESAVAYTVVDNTGTPLRPGRPIAVPGPDRALPPGSTALSAAGSWFADTFNWLIVSMPTGGDGTLSNLTGLTTTFNATVAGPYQIKLAASKGALQADTKLLNIEVINPWPLSISSPWNATSISNPVPADIRFSNIKKVLQESGSCADLCHNPGDSKPPPILYGYKQPLARDIDRIGDGSAVSAANDIAFYNEVLGRINFGDISSSLLLRHPSGYNHNGGLRPGFGAQSTIFVSVSDRNPVSGVPADQLPPGDPRRSYYDMFLNWILNGAPY